MTTIWYNDIENVSLSLTDPNTWWAVSNVPWVSSPKINAWTSVYNEQWWWGSGIAWWSTDVKWTPHNWSISWSSGSISLPDWTSISISWWSQSITSSTYLYVDTTDWTVYATTHSYDAVWEFKIMICAAFPNSWKNVSFKAFWCADQSSLTYLSNIANWTIVANNIASWTITANEIASGTITANEIAGNTITASEIASWAITSSKIDSGAVTASKINVNTLSAITGNMWDLYVWDINNWNWINIYPYSSSQGRIQFYYNGSSVGYIEWQYSSWVWRWVVMLNWDYIVLDWDTYMLSRDKLDLSQAKLRIPVWDNLY